VRNDSSSLVATDVQRLNAGCEDSASPASFSVGGAKLLAPLGIPDRYLDYILNLTVKVFLFKKDADVFEKDTNQKRSNAYIKKLEEF
jgi:hypothetical protein